MKPLNVVVRLSWLIAGLALLASGMGLFYRDAGSPFSFTSLRGQPVEIYGQGLYRYDTLFAGAGNKGTDTVTLSLAIPLLVLSTLLYQRGSIRGALLLMGASSWFLYVYASYALGAVAYNDLFLVYVALFSASLFTLVSGFRSLIGLTLGAHFSHRLPHRSLVIFLFISGIVTLVVWLITPVTALLQRTPPERLDTYTTLFTNAVDMAVIVPLVFIAALLISRRDPFGYLLAFPLLVLEAMLAPLITLQTIYQLGVGVTFPTAQIVGPISGFVTIAVIALWFIVAILRNVPEQALQRQDPGHAVAV